MDNDNNISLTPKQMDEIMTELQQLKTVRLMENVRRLKAAQALDNFAESEEYIAAKKEHLEIHARIKEIEKIMRDCIVI